ncbi:hypothetical protein HDU99_006963, partial [Rhizoclosmatium hyalinum]
CTEILKRVCQPERMYLELIDSVQDNESEISLPANPVVNDLVEENDQQTNQTNEIGHHEGRGGENDARMIASVTSGWVNVDRRNATNLDDLDNFDTISQLLHDESLSRQSPMGHGGSADTGGSFVQALESGDIDW